MSESRTIRFYHSKDYDWVWVYADDRLIHSAHSCSGRDLLEALDYEDFESYSEHDTNTDEALWGLSHDPERSEMTDDLFKRDR